MKNKLTKEEQIYTFFNDERRKRYNCFKNYDEDNNKLSINTKYNPLNGNMLCDITIPNKDNIQRIDFYKNAHQFTYEYNECYNYFVIVVFYKEDKDVFIHDNVIKKYPFFEFSINANINDKEQVKTITCNDYCFPKNPSINFPENPNIKIYAFNFYETGFNSCNDFILKARNIKYDEIDGIISFILKNKNQ